VLSVAARARALRASGWRHVRSVRVTIDPNAPCFQLGNAQHMTARRSAELEHMYVNAGFAVVPLAHLGRGRRTVQRVLELS